MLSGVKLASFPGSPERELYTRSRAEEPGNEARVKHEVSTVYEKYSCES